MANPAFSLKDGFDDATLDAGKWPNSFGYYNETGGRIQTGLDPNYNGVSSAKDYWIAGSQVVVQPFPPATMPDGATEAWMQLLVLSNVAGTDLGWSIEVRTGEISAFSRTGYWDPESSYTAYDPVDHAWLRISEADGTVTWSTSPDGHTWTPLRTIPTPAWAATDTDVELQMISHRADGTNNYAEWDNFNLLPPTLVNLGSAGSSMTGRPVVARKRRTLGQATVAQTATALRVIKRRSIGQASSTTTARSLLRAKTKGLGAAASGVSAMALKALRKIPAGLGGAVNTGHGLDPSKLRKLGNPARTADQAAPLVAKKRHITTVVAYATASQAVRAVRFIGVGRATQSATARPITARKAKTLGVPGVTNTANAMSVRKTRVIGAAATEGASHGLSATHRYSMAPAVYEATGWPVLSSSGTTLGAASTAQTAQPLAHRHTTTIGHASTTTSARPITFHKLDPRSTPAEEVDTASGVTARKRLTLGVAHQADSARPPAGRVKQFQVGAAVPVAHLGSGVKAVKRRSLGSASSSTAAQPVDPNKTRRVGAAAAAMSARPVVWKRTVRLNAGSTKFTSNTLNARKSRHLAPCAAAQHAGAVAVRKARPLGRGAVVQTGLDVRSLKRLILGVAREQSGANGAGLPVLNRLLDTAGTADRAHGLTARKPLPAETLALGISGPELTPAVQEPTSQAGTSGPTLITYSTSGGT